MSNINQIINVEIWQYVKYFYLLFIFIYVVFAAIIIRQIQLMVSTLNGTLDFPFKTISIIHFFVALIVFLLSIVVL